VTLPRIVYVVKNDSNIPRDESYDPSVLDFASSFSCRCVFTAVVRTDGTLPLGDSAT
jgi:hypothetical protein